MTTSTTPWGGPKIPVAVLGATGSVGQRFLCLLADHPWFEVRALTASERSVGKAYSEAAPWLQTIPVPSSVAGMVLRPTAPDSAADCPLVFSALGSGPAGPAEEAFAAAGHLVVSNARSHRLDPDVPLMVPEVNPEHLGLVEAQRERFPGGGAILTNPNCSTIGFVLALKPLAESFGLTKVHVVTLQAVSGSGLPGVPSIQILDNLIPFIPGEEEKLQPETSKILGRLADGHIEEHPAVVSATCTRVPVTDGHTCCVSVELERPVSLEEVLEAWSSFTAAPQQLGLPTAPARPLHYLDAPDAPQPRLHRDLDRGMATTLGRLRPCPLLSYKFVTLSHNTLRGAAGGALLVAELAAARGRVPGYAVSQISGEE